MKCLPILVGLITIGCTDGQVAKTQDLEKRLAELEERTEHNQRVNTLQDSQIRVLWEELNNPSCDSTFRMKDIYGGKVVYSNLNTRIIMAVDDEYSLVDESGRELGEKGTKLELCGYLNKHGFSPTKNKK